MLAQRGDHSSAFDAVHYEKRFELSEDGMAHLERLVDLSRQKDVYLICQCEDGLKCHRDLLLIIARVRFGAQTEPMRFNYPTFAKRLQQVTRQGP